MKMPVPGAAHVDARCSTSSVFTSPPVVIDAPGSNCCERDSVDGTRPVGDQRAGKLGGLESQDAADLAAVDGDLADVQDMAAVRLAVGVSCEQSPSSVECPVG